MLLIPLVVLTLASIGWRMMRFYLGGEEYVLGGPPHVVPRVFVAPVMLLSTIVGALLATATLPAADRLQDRATSHLGFDRH
jgi:hypothetical protein